MKWSDIPFQPTRPVLRRFAGAWLIFFLVWAGVQTYGRGHPRAGLILAALAVGVGGIGLVKPQAVRWIFVGWMVLAFPIGWLISQLMLALLFFGIFTPLAVFFRLRGRDVLRLRRPSGAQTYWMAKSTPENVRTYFRPY
jgi:Saxitoxin biosynthesis operon protein SxtJ